MTAHKPGQLNTGTAGVPGTSPVPQATLQPGRYEIDTTYPEVRNVPAPAPMPTR
jgi:hypothetical protein